MSVGFSLRDNIHSHMLSEMFKSLNSTQPGVQKTWNLIHQGIYKHFGIYFIGYR